ncbi:hypothetical protein [Bacillus cereus]
MRKEDAFAKLATQYLEEPGSKGTGGNLGEQDP